MKDMTLQGRNAVTRGAITLLVLGASGLACADSIELPNPDYQLRWDNTVRYTLGMRTEGQDSRIMNNPNYDESDGKFNKGDVVTNRLDLLTELDFSYLNNWGARMSAAGWYDQAYDDSSVSPSNPAYGTSYNNNHYSSQVSRYVNGPSGEILDAFVWKNFSLAGALVNLKVGRQTNYWGEGLLFSAHSISYVWTRLHCQPAFEHGYPVASMYKAYSRKPIPASGQHWFSSWHANYIQASRASRSAGINPRRSDLGSMFSSKGWSGLTPRWQNSVDQWLIAA